MSRLTRSASVPPRLQPDPLDLLPVALQVQGVVVRAPDRVRAGPRVRVAVEASGDLGAKGGHELLVGEVLELELGKLPNPFHRRLLAFSQLPLRVCGFHLFVARILVVDDERAAREALERALRLEGYDVELASDGEEGLSLHEHQTSDLILLDVLMPRLDGLETCRRLRATGDATPVLLLTARVEVEDRVEGLDAGADDYLTKPFALDELLARVRALLRRRSAPDRREVLRYADIALDTGTFEVFRGERRLELTRMEFQLLELFLRCPRRVLTRSLIFERVWGFNFGASSNALDVYIGYLRRKLEAGGEPRLIQTIRGVGYALREP